MIGFPELNAALSNLNFNSFHALRSFIADPIRPPSVTGGGGKCFGEKYNLLYRRSLPRNVQISSSCGSPENNADEISEVCFFMG